MIDRLPDLVNDNEPLVRRGQFLSVEFLVEVGNAPFYVRIERGRVVGVEAGSGLLRPWCFAIRASADAWRRFWEPMPRPGYHDIFAMVKAGEARVEGDLQPLMANLQFIKDVLAAPRRLTEEGS